MRTAVIGIGNMGRHHARVYSEISKLVAVADINEGSREMMERYGCKFYKDYKDMLNKERIDAVTIAVPTSMHKKVALDVIEKGVNILIEKPIADNIEDAKEIIKKAREMNVKLMVGHIERFNPAVIKLKEIITDGGLGEIVSVSAKRVGIAPSKIPDSDVIKDLAIHDIHIFNYLLNKEPDKVYCLKGKALINKREDYAELLLRYGSTNATIQVNWITPVKIRNLSITGTKGYAELNYITQDLEVHKSNYEREWDGFGDFIIKFGSPVKETIPINKEEPLKLELKSFLDAVENNKEVRVSGEDALNALKVVMQIE
jgi:UDP-N-acetylglucosamine 3-dehydrogenase